MGKNKRGRHKNTKVGSKREIRTIPPDRGKAKNKQNKKKKKNK